MPKRLTITEQRLRNEMWSQGQLWCSECKRFLPVKKFTKDRARKANYGYRFYCSECENTRRRNPERQKLYYQKRNRELKEGFVVFAGGSCHRCGFSGSTAAMDFHHVYPAEKRYNPATLIYGGEFEKTWQELDKCCMLCANCHSAYEAGEWRAEFIKRDGLGWTVGTELPLDDTRYQAERPPAYHQATLPDALRPIMQTQMVLLEKKAFYYG